MTARPFIHDDFLLETPTARTLYHDYAAAMPILDYHCHLPPQDVAGDKRWENLAQVWLGGDHYKWRLLRANGVDERLITGDAPDRAKFDAFAATMPYLLRNPMYDWSHLELARYFGITDLLSPRTAGAVWERANAELATPACSARGLMTRSRVRLVCTTDDPADTLEHHRRVAADKGFAVRMLPTWRPDKALAIDRPAFWNGWLDKLAAAAGAEVRTWDDFLRALQTRHDFFADAGCRLSDYGLETVYAAPYTEAGVRAAFAKVRGGGTISPGAVEQFRSAVLFECGRMDAAAGWTWQIHYGALRNTNTRMFKALGPDTGFDTIGDWPVARALARLFDRLDQIDALPQTIVYTLNPRQRAARRHDRQLPARPGGGQDAARQRLVVQRPARRHAPPDRGAVAGGNALPLCRHAHRQPLVPQLHPPRVLPAHPLQPARRRHRGRPHPRRRRLDGRDRQGHLLPQRRPLLRVPVHP